MAPISSKHLKLHNESLNRLHKQVLSLNDKDFVIDNFNEGIERVISTKGIFFTPPEMALAFCIEVTGNRVVDLCAGIGMLSYYYLHHGHHPRIAPDKIELVCIERNPDFVEVGKKVLPEATWISADITEPGLLSSLGLFDMAISNPPFGSVSHTEGCKLNYQGNNFEYKAIELASRVARHGTFIIPQGSTPFKYSGQRQLEDQNIAKYNRFHQQTKISIKPSCGIDTSVYQQQWRFTQVATEIVCCDFSDCKLPGYQSTLF